MNIIDLCIDMDCEYCNSRGDKESFYCRRTGVYFYKYIRVNDILETIIKRYGSLKFEKCTNYDTVKMITKMEQI